MTCPACAGKQSQGCELCTAGRIEIDQCPLEVITGDIWECMHYAALYEKGLPPIAGGALDQAWVFTKACEMIWAEEARYKCLKGT